MRVWRFLQKVLKPQIEAAVPDHIVQLAQQRLRIANESAQIAAKSSVFETRLSRLNVARENLRELRFLAEQFPRLTLTSLHEFEHGLSEFAREVETEACLHPLQRGGMHDGWEYRAVMNLSTPLRHLVLHGNRDLNKIRQPESPMGEYGSWWPKLKTFRQIGVDADEPAPFSMSSPIGPIPVDGGAYLAFLIAVREQVEACGTIDSRLRGLCPELDKSRWLAIVSKPGHYREAICGYFFPTFLSMIPGLPHLTQHAMWDVALDTPNRISAASDKDLLAFKGVGPAMLEKIRRRCAEATSGRDEPRLDRVNYE